MGISKQNLPIPAVRMDLVGVLCIETSHYVAFSRVGSVGEEHWVLFDSMADREGASDGYNIPQVSSCPEIARWLTPEGFQQLRALIEEKNVDSLPKYLQRLLNDSYICFYVWPDAELYGNRSEVSC